MYRQTILLFLTIFMCSCVTTKPISGRLYDLQDGSIIEIELSNYFEGYGKASGKIKNGEHLSGEYTLNNRTTRQIPHVSPGSLFSGASKSDVPESKSSIPEKGDPSWQEIYGFSPGSDARPVGTATLVGDKGSIVNIVFFSADTHRGVADGIARTNKGKWYRVHIGNLAITK